MFRVRNNWTEPHVASPRGRSMNLELARSFKEALNLSHVEYAKSKLSFSQAWIHVAGIQGPKKPQLVSMRGKFLWLIPVETSGPFGTGAGTGAMSLKVSSLIGGAPTHCPGTGT